MTNSIENLPATCIPQDEPNGCPACFKGQPQVQAFKPIVEGGLGETQVHIVVTGPYCAINTQPVKTGKTCYFRLIRDPGPFFDWKSKQRHPKW